MTTTPKQNKALVQAYAERINAKDLDGALAFLSPNFVEHAPGPGLSHGVEAARAWFTLLFAGFPDHHATILDVIAEGDKVVTRMCSEGTHNGAFMGIPPTGKRARWSLIDIHRIADGKIVEHWVETDMLGMMQQLGIMPPPQGDKR
jgi:steroid delta-isomerase-like uncharacterized protein